MKFWKYTLLPIITASAVLFTGCQSKQEEVSEPEEPVIIDPLSIKFDWQNAYESKLKEFMQSDMYTDKKKGSIQPSMFDICDLNGDNIPELVISPDTDHTTVCKVFSFMNSVFTPVGDLGSNGTFKYFPDLHILNEEYNGDGFIIGKYVTIEEQQFKQVLTYSDNTASASSGARIVHEINSDEVSLSEYDAAIAQFSGSNSYNAGRKYTFGDESINYAVYYADTWGAVLSSEQTSLCINKLTEAMDQAKSAGKDAAFELCDLNGDNIPELIISEGTGESDVCHIYYFNNTELSLLDGTYGNGGKLSFDIVNKVFFSADSSQTAYWSLSDPDFSAADYKSSGSIMECGRKYMLNDININSVFGASGAPAEETTAEEE